MSRILPPYFCAVIVIGACVHDGGPAPATYEFSRKGDDGLTVKIGEAVLASLDSSGEFALATVQGAAILRIEIDGHAVWQRVDERVDATVGLKVYRSDSLAAVTTPRCYEDELEVCGRSALEFARRHVGQE